VKLGVNLISNPGAENVDDANQPVGWKTAPTGTDSVDRYGHAAGEWDYDCTNCGLPPHAGRNYFRAPADLEEGQQHKSLTQSIDLVALKDSIKTGNVRYHFGAQMAGFRCEEPHSCAFGYVKVEFFNAADSLLQSRTTKRTMNEFHRVDDGPDADSRMYQFQPVELADSVPPDARRVQVTLGAEQNCANEGDCSSAYVFFDELSLVLAGKHPAK
jgi:hypothetical protein